MTHANVWGGPNAEPPKEDEAKLFEWTVEVPDPETLERAAKSLAARNPVVRAGSGDAPALVVDDPWYTAVRLRVAGL